MTQNEFSELADIHPRDLRARGSYKWTQFAPAIGAWVAESDLGTAPAIRSALRLAIDEDALGYVSSSNVTALAESTSTFALRRYGWDIDPAHVAMLPDAVRGLEIAMTIFVADSSPVIVPTPAYTPFLKVPGAYGRRVIEVPAVQSGGAWSMDLDGIESAFVHGGRILVLCNPHNPTGRVFRIDELRAIADIVERHGGIVFADELHAPLTYDGIRHIPYSTVSAAAAEHSFTVLSASKAWNIAGLKCAQIILTSDRLRALWTPRSGRISHGASTLGVLANVAAYTDGYEWLDDAVTYLAQNRTELVRALQEILPETRMYPPQATYLAWIDCAGLQIAGSAAEHFLENAGVATVDGATCGVGFDDFIRFNFALPRHLIRPSVELMAASLME